MFVVAVDECVVDAFPGEGGGESISTKQIMFIKYGCNALQFRLTLTVKVYTQVQRTRLTPLPSSQRQMLGGWFLGFDVSVNHTRSPRDVMDECDSHIGQ